MTGGGGTVILASPVFPTSVTVNIAANLGYTFSGTTFGAAWPATPGNSRRLAASAARPVSPSPPLVPVRRWTTTKRNDQYHRRHAPDRRQRHRRRRNSTATTRPSPARRERAQSSLAAAPSRLPEEMHSSSSTTRSGALFKTNNAQMPMALTPTQAARSLPAAIRQGHDNAIPANSDVTSQLFNPTNTAATQGGQLALFGYNLTLNSILSRFDNLTTGKYRHWQWNDRFDYGWRHGRLDIDDRLGQLRRRADRQSLTDQEYDQLPR
jgi:hypothetical protein